MASFCYFTDVSMNDCECSADVGEAEIAEFAKAVTVDVAIGAIQRAYREGGVAEARGLMDLVLTDPTVKLTPGAAGSR